MEAHDLCSVHFGVADGGEGMDLKIVDPEENQIYSRTHVEKGKHTFTAHREGKYDFCFENHGGKVRRVHLDVKMGFEARDYTRIAKKEHLKPLEVDMLKMEDAVKEIHEEMEYMRDREIEMRNTNGKAILLKSSRTKLYPLQIRPVRVSLALASSLLSSWD